MKNKFKIGILLSIILAVTSILVYDSKRFYSVFGESSAYGWIIAIAAEALAAAMILIRGGKWFLGVRIFVLSGLFMVIVSGAALWSVKPIIDSDKLGAADRLRLEQINATIDSYRTCLDAVSGQKANSAIASRRLGAANDEKMKLLDKISSGSENKIANWYMIVVLAFMRVLFQSGNWLMIHYLGRMINPPPREPISEEQEKLLNYISERGGYMPREDVVKSKCVTGATAREYDGLAKELARKGYIVKLFRNGTRNKKEMIWRAV